MSFVLKGDVISISQVSVQTSVKGIYTKICRNKRHPLGIASQQYLPLVFYNLDFWEISS